MTKPVIFYVLMGVALLMLESCVNREMTVQRAQTLSACKQACENRLQACHRICQNNCKTCSQSSHCSTRFHYDRYKHEQCVQGLEIVRQLKSYRDPLQCRKTTCNCWADYNVCRQACKGVIHKRLQVSPACC